MLTNNLFPWSHISYPSRCFYNNFCVINNCFSMIWCVCYKMAIFSLKIDIPQFQTFNCSIHESHTSLTSKPVGISTNHLPRPFSWSFHWSFKALFTFSTNQSATIAPTPFSALPPPPPPPLHSIIYPFPISLVPFAFQITPANNKYQCEVSSESQQFPQISLRMYQHSRRKARFVPVYQEFFSYQSTGALKSSYGIQCVPSSEGRHWWCLKGTLGVTPPYNILTIINEIKLAKIVQ